MTYLDYGLLAVLALSIAWGAWRGLVHEMISLGGWIIAFLAANLFGAAASELLTESIPAEARVMLGGLAVFVVVLLAASLVGMLLRKFIKSVGLAASDRVLGALFGLARGVIIWLAFALLAGLTRLPSQPAWKDSFLGLPLANTVIQLKPWLPSALAGRLRYH
jgi:membrane protein required for colicin V production